MLKLNYARPHGIMPGNNDGARIETFSILKHSIQILIE